MLSRPLRALIVGVAAAALAGGIAATGLLDRIEASSVDQRFDVRGSQGAPEDVLVVGIDEATYDVHGFPFERSLHALVIERLLNAGARRIAYDVQFSEPLDRRDDARLVDAVRDPRVLLGTAEATRSGTPVVMPALRRAAEGRVGIALFPHDHDVIRRFEPSVLGVPHLAVLAASGDPGTPARPLDFAGPPGTVPELSLDDIVTGRFDPAAVRDKVVVVGATAPILHDVDATAAGAPMPGPEIVANAIQTVLDGYPLRDAPPAVAALLVLAAGLLAPLAAALPGPPGRVLLQALGAGLAGAAALLVGAQLAFDGGTIVPVAAPLLALLFGTAGAVATTYAVEVRTRRRLRTEFERFVAPAVASELLELGAPGAPVQSRRLDATVLFCDLRGFTTLAERLEAEQVIAVLNRYLTLVSGEVLDRGGTVVSYQGDGMMAVFGAPLPQGDHAARALSAARAIFDGALPRFNAWLLEERLADAPLAAGIGINSGPVMSGIVGSERRVEYAAVGDATNVAARLQALGRDLPGELFVSASTVDALGGAAAAAAARLHLHGDVSLKGRREPVTVWIGD
ncbi:adenylate/guanylate cyclase domain-containing protein [Conexibacter woesei]|nr:adenylate/guanylate cyclase domain-containing protein [Conexibacter woesei]